MNYFFKRIKEVQIAISFIQNQYKCLLSQDLKLFFDSILEPINKRTQMGNKIFDVSQLKSNRIKLQPIATNPEIEPQMVQLPPQIRLETQQPINIVVERNLTLEAVEQVLTCSICQNQYDLQHHIPMQLCPEVHHCCEACLQQIVRCPYCMKQLGDRRDMKKYRLIIKIIEEKTKLNLEHQQQHQMVQEQQEFGQRQEEGFLNMIKFSKKETIVLSERDKDSQLQELIKKYRHQKLVNRIKKNMSSEIELIQKQYGKERLISEIQRNKIFGSLCLTQFLHNLLLFMGKNGFKAIYLASCLISIINIITKSVMMERYSGLCLIQGNLEQADYNGTINWLYFAIYQVQTFIHFFVLSFWGCSGDSVLCECIQSCRKQPLSQFSVSARILSTIVWLIQEVFLLVRIILKICLYWRYRGFIDLRMQNQKQDIYYSCDGQRRVYYEFIILFVAGVEAVIFVVPIIITIIWKIQKYWSEKEVMEEQ